MYSPHVVLMVLSFVVTPRILIPKHQKKTCDCTFFPFIITHCEPPCSDSDIGPHFFLKKRHGDDDDGRETSPYMLGHHQKNSRKNCMTSC